MAKLTLTFQESPVGEFPLGQELTTIGRNGENDIRIDNLSVSGHHARIIRVINDYFFEDLDSTNGTQVNGHPVKRHTLRHGDRITIGKHQLLFEGEQHDAEAVDLERTVAIRPSVLAELTDAPDPVRNETASAEAASGLSAPATAAGATPIARLQILNGPNAGRDLELTKEVTNIGRKGVQVVAISRRDGRYYLVSIDGGQGEARYPRINDQPTGPQAWLLHDQDVLEIAGVKMGFFVSG